MSFVNGFISSKVELKPGKYGFGLFVKSDVKKDEVLLDIPHESAFRYKLIIPLTGKQHPKTFFLVQNLNPNWVWII